MKKKLNAAIRHMWCVCDFHCVNYNLQTQLFVHSWSEM